MKNKKEKEIARKIYLQERKLKEEDIRRREKARQKMINRKKAQEEAEQNTKPVKRVKGLQEKSNDARGMLNTGARVSAEGRGWINIGNKFGLF